MSISAACHIHSEWSYDGKWSLPALVREFGRKGYRVLMVTEHDRGFTPERLQRFREACLQARSQEVLVVPGIEYSDATNTVHLLVWGPVPFLGEGRDSGALLESVRSHSGVAVLAHPSRRNAWRQFDPRWKPLLLGIEIWNRKTDGWAPSTDAERMIDGDLLPFVGTDFHTRKQMFPLSMRLPSSTVFDEEGVLACLRSRRCAPEAFGRPLASALHGPLNLTLRAAERCRRALARSYRLVSK